VDGHRRVQAPATVDPAWTFLPATQDTTHELNLATLQAFRRIFLPSPLLDLGRVEIALTAEVVGIDTVCKILHR
jgi:hypothetical protein